MLANTKNEFQIRYEREMDYVKKMVKPLEGCGQEFAAQRTINPLQVFLYVYHPDVYEQGMRHLEEHVALYREEEKKT
jgi:hypothetical protein